MQISAQPVLCHYIMSSKCTTYKLFNPSTIFSVTNISAKPLDFSFFIAATTACKVIQYLVKPTTKIFSSLLSFCKFYINLHRFIVKRKITCWAAWASAYLSLILPSSTDVTRVKPFPVLRIIRLKYIISD